MIITYYSYKGGSGRSQLLANIASYLCHHKQKKILLIDWDLEAPGLHFFFNKIKFEHLGLIDFFNNYINLSKNVHSEAEEFTEEFILDELSKNFQNYFKCIVEDGNGKIDLMPAGKYTEEFLHNVNVFDWKSYYEDFDGANHIEVWKKYLKSLDYDFIFIDSRTGVHDYSGICNIQMADANVIVITPTRQSFEGSKIVINSIIESKYVKTKYREPIVLPILSRIDPNSNQLKGEWISKFKDEFEDVIRSWIDFRFDAQQRFITLFSDKKIIDKEINNFIDQTYLEYKTDISFGEKVLFTINKEKILENTFQRTVSNIAKLHFILKDSNYINEDRNSIIHSLLNRRKELYELIISINKLLQQNPTNESINTEYNKIKNEILTISESVYNNRDEILKIADLYNSLLVKTETLLKSKKYFKSRDIKSAINSFHVETMAEELENLLKFKEKYNQRLNEIAYEFMMLACLTAIEFELSDNLIKTEIYFNLSLKAFKNEENLFEYAHFLENNKQYSKSLLLYEESLAIYRQLFVNEKKLYHYRVGICLNNIANIKNLQNQVIEAEVYYKEALKILSEVNEETSDKYLQYLAGINFNLGNLYKNQNKLKDAVDKYSTSINIYENFAKINPQGYLPYLVQAKCNQANLYKLQNNFLLANVLYEEVLANYLQLALVKPELYQKNVAATLNDIGNVKYSINELEKAEMSYSQALNIYQQLSQANPEAYLPALASTLNNMGNLLSDRNELEKAEKSYLEALDIRRKLSIVNPEAYLPDVASTLNNMGNLLSAKNELEKAEKSYIEALSIYQQLSTNSSNNYLAILADTLNNIGNLQRAKNELEKAEKSYLEALEIRRKLSMVNPEAYLPALASTLNNMGNLLSAKNELEKAEKSYLEALEIRRKLSMVNPEAYLPDVASTLNNMGNLLSAKNELEKAEKSYLEALEIRRKLSMVNPEAYLPALANTLNNMGNLLSAKNELEKAEKSYIEALIIYQQLSQASPEAYLPAVANSLNNIGNLQSDRNESEKAEKSYLEALNIKRKLVKLSPAAFDISLADTYICLSNLYRYNLVNKNSSLTHAQEAYRLYFKYQDSVPHALKWGKEAYDIIRFWQAADKSPTSAKP